MISMLRDALLCNAPQHEVGGDGALRRACAVERRPHAVFAVPASAGCTLGIFRCALLEEVGVFDAVEDLDEPRQWVLFDLFVAAFGGFEIAEYGRQLELRQPP